MTQNRGGNQPQSPGRSQTQNPMQPNRPGGNASPDPKVEEQEEEESGNRQEEDEESSSIRQDRPTGQGGQGGQHSPSGGSPDA